MSDEAANLREQLRLANIDALQNEARANDAESERDALRAAVTRLEGENARGTAVIAAAIKREVAAQASKPPDLPSIAEFDADMELIAAVRAYHESHQ